MLFTKRFSSHWLVLSAIAVALVLWTPTVNAQADPVTVEITVGSGAMPGATVTATATVTINDGSTIQTYAWSQPAGVEASLSGADGETVTLALGAETAYKAMLMHVLVEPPIAPEHLPPGVEFPEGEFPGGQQDRFEVVGINPFALEEAGAVSLEVMVTTTSGTYTGTGAVHTMLPWKPSAGIYNVGVGLAVLLNGMTQTAYDWALTVPDGSAATLMDATTQNPDFTPDVPGAYGITVTNEVDASTVSMTVYAGTWRGIIVGQDDNMRPVSDSACTGCHSGYAPDKFTPWAQTGHAEIFSNNLDTSTHYGENCFTCHTVGFDPDVDNMGVDEAADYQAFLDAGLLNVPGDNWTTVLADFPETAKKANVQCESCHGPQDSDAHTTGMPRQNLSSDICATCHGEPLRHARFQQWQLSAHANYELAIDEAGSGTCSKCHTANGFMAWLPVLTGEVDGDVNDSVEVTWTPEESHPQTCAVCHDPHASGTGSGSDPGEHVTVRISGDTPELVAGFTATDVGMGAMCMTCHNTRRGLRNDSTWDRSDSTRAPHLGAQTDLLMGQNAYFVDVDQRSFHSRLEDSCVDCHMEATPPPADLAYNLGGTNHTFYASSDICANEGCHSLMTAEDVQVPVEAGMHMLQDAIEAEYLAMIDAATMAGNTIDLNGEATLTSAADIDEIVFTETRGRQALAVTIVGGVEIGAQGIANIDIVPTTGDPVAISDVASDELLKSGWNYLLLHADGSHGVHNPAWTMQVLTESQDALDGSGGGTPGGDDTGPGVACTSAYTYWVEIAAHLPGLSDSQWRTDVVTRNSNDGAATLQFILHTSSGNQTLDATVDAGAQGIFEDIVGIMGLEDKGALEICSDVPLRVVARIYNQGELCEMEGTFGQFIDGLTNLLGLGEGQTASLLGLRQSGEEWRTNISITNTGAAAASVMIDLYGTDGTAADSFTVSVDPGTVHQEIEPFGTNAPDIGWGYAEVTVVSGSGILASASVIDAAFNDATTIPMKR